MMEDSELNNTNIKTVSDSTVKLSVTQQEINI